MKSTVYIYCVLFLFLFSCEGKSTEPLWPLNTNELILPSKEIVFNWSTSQKHRAILYTFSQPIELPISIKDKKCYISLKQIIGVTEGPGKLCIIGKKNYCFPVILTNRKHKNLKIRNFYSPRIFNPDSNLMQQKISINMDSFKNLHPVKATDYFFEEITKVPSKTGTYCPEVNNPLSCFYVKSGACSIIPLKEFNIENHSRYLEAGPLLDNYGNLIANGTLLKFIFYNEKNTYIREELVMKGYAKINLNLLSFNPNRVQVMIGEKLSKELMLTK